MPLVIASASSRASAIVIMAIAPGMLPLSILSWTKRIAISYALSSVLFVFVSIRFVLYSVYHIVVPFLEQDLCVFCYCLLANILSSFAVQVALYPQCCVDCRGSVSLVKFLSCHVTFCFVNSSSRVRTSDASYPLPAHAYQLCVTGPWS